MVNKKNDVVIANKVAVANTFVTRLRGLMFKKNFEENSAIMIFPCKIIHTFFMRFSIDVIFLSKDNMVLNIIENMTPGKISSLVKDSQTIVELPTGKVKESKLKQGDIICITEI